MTERITPIYSGKPEDFNWIGFGSGKGTNLRECAKVKKPVLIFSDRSRAELLELEEFAKIKKIVLDGYDYCGDYEKIKGNKRLMAAYKKRSLDYNEKILRLLKDFEIAKGITIDLIVLGGYRRFVERPILEAYRDKIINVHPSSLPVSEELRYGVKCYKRKYIGRDSVYDAIKAGEVKTRSSVIVIDNFDNDYGEILMQGPELAVEEEFLKLNPEEKKNKLREYADKHQEKQKEVSDWPAITAALKMIAEGRIALGSKRVHYDKWRTVYVDGKPLKYNGYQVGGK